MKLLGVSIVKSFNSAIISSTVNDFGEELEFLQFKIDRDFISSDEKNVFWKEIFRNQLWSLTDQVENTIVPIEWGADHPFNKIFIEKSVGEIVVLNKEFKNRIGFFKSENNFEIRIADIVSSIMYRYLNYNECNQVLDTLRPLNLISGLFNLVRFTNKRSQTKNPYLELN